jgi:hypothetical protein
VRKLHRVRWVRSYNRTAFNERGTRAALSPLARYVLCAGVTIRGFRQLIAWQRCAELRREVLAFTARMPCKADRDFCWDIRRSARSAPSNVAEGFVRYGHPEFLHFLKIALASLAET